MEDKFRRTGIQVSPYWFGTNLEHSRSDIFRGLSAQMLRMVLFQEKVQVKCAQFPRSCRPGQPARTATDSAIAVRYSASY